MSDFEKKSPKTTVEQIPKSGLAATTPFNPLSQKKRSECQKDFVDGCNGRLQLIAHNIIMSTWSLHFLDCTFYTFCVEDISETWRKSSTERPGWIIPPLVPSLNPWSVKGPYIVHCIEEVLGLEVQQWPCFDTFKVGWFNWVMFSAQGIQKGHCELHQLLPQAMLWFPYVSGGWPCGGLVVQSFIVQSWGANWKSWWKTDTVTS